MQALVVLPIAYAGGSKNRPAWLAVLTGVLVVFCFVFGSLILSEYNDSSVVTTYSLKHGEILMQLCVQSSIYTVGNIQMPKIVIITNLNAPLVFKFRHQQQKLGFELSSLAINISKKGGCGHNLTLQCVFIAVGDHLSSFCFLSPSYPPSHTLSTVQNIVQCFQVVCVYCSSI